MEFKVLGPLEVTDGGEPLELGTPRQRQLVGLLLVHAGETVTYDRLADQLWEGAPPQTARHTLQGYVHRLRRILGREAWRLSTRPHGYQLKVSAGELDARAFEDLASGGHRALVRGDPQAAVTALEAALRLWRGQAFEGLGELVAFDAERARLEAFRMTALEDRIDADLALGRHDHLIAELHTLLGDHPFRERLWGQLMVACYRAGRQADALKAFRSARQTLADELGIHPGRWLSRLHEQILLQDPALDAPQAVQPPPARHNLPAPRDSFVGRRREIADLEGLLRTRRLVTVTGPPGVGKSRLAIEAASRMVDVVAHGVFLVPLADVDDARLVPAAIATAVGVPPVTDRSIMEALVDHLRSRQVLLIADNFEHLLDTVPQVTSLLDAAAQLTVLATSRTPLRLAGEQEYPLHPLMVPDPHDHTAAATSTDAVVLFADRATAVDPRFALTADNEGTVADIVARLDGLPLAIELAAARLRHFPLDELRRRLSPALPLLTAGVSDAPAHQQTLRTAIAWSEKLLTAADRALLRRLAVFRGGVTVAAAQAVAGSQPVDDVVESLSRLVEVSLLARPDDADPARYGMLETVREYALEQLRDADEERGIRDRHARFYAAMIDEAAPHLMKVEQATWLGQLDVEHPNIRGALDWVVKGGETDLALEMTAGMWRYWQLRGHLIEGQRWLEAALAADHPSPVPQIRALLGLAGICYWQFDLDTAETAYVEARDLARTLDQWWLELEALFGLVATLACHRGDISQAAELEAEFHALAAEKDDPVAMGLGLATSQMMRLLAGDLSGSRHYGQLCLAATRQAGERWYEVQVLRTLALASLRQERYEQARQELSQCVDIALELGDLPGLAMDLDRLGQVAAILGEHERGCVLAGAADRLRESVGAQVTVEAFRWEQQPAQVTAQRALDETEVQRAFARGRSMTPEQAAAYAHAEPPTRTRETQANKT